jgi:tellurite resistance-related uncharacterized protein
MQRAITGFHRDEVGDFVAELCCGHVRHVRHDPPLAFRPWVVSDAGRRSRIGQPLACVRCDRRELPEGFAPYRSTRVFDPSTLPAALRSRHETGSGVWALIHVTRGSVEYRVHEPFHTREQLVPGRPGVVLPEVPHELRPEGAFELHVEFWRRESGAGSP